MHIKKILFIPAEGVCPMDTASVRTGMRLEEGLRLWKKGGYEIIIVSGGIVMSTHTQTQPLGIIMSDYLIRLGGVGRQYILAETESVDTYQNIEFTHTLLQKQGYTPQETELTIVSQWQHAWRAALTARAYGYLTKEHTVAYPFESIETGKEYLFMFCHFIDRKGTGILAQYNRRQRHLNTTK